MKAQFSNAMLKRLIIEKTPVIGDHVDKYGPVFMTANLRELQKSLKVE